MIRFYYSPDGNYDTEVLDSSLESILFDKQNNKVTLFGSVDFPFMTLSDACGVDASSSSIGLSQKGGYVILDALNIDVSTLNSSLIELEEKIGMEMMTFDSSDVDLEIADEDGYVLTQFYKGQFRVKYFDTSIVNSSIDLINTSILGMYDEFVLIEDSIDPSVDLQISDENGYVLAEFANGGFRVKYFDTSIINSSVNRLQNILLGTSDDIEDSEFNLIERVELLEDYNTEVVCPHMTSANSSINYINSSLGTLRTIINNNYSDQGYKISNVSTRLNSSINEVIDMLTESERDWADIFTFMDGSLNITNSSISRIDSSLVDMMNRIIALEGYHQS